MREGIRPPNSSRGYSEPVQIRDLDLLEGLLVEGLSMAIFDYSMTCETGNNGRRLLIVRAGKSHKFTITEDECPAIADDVRRSLGWGRQDANDTEVQVIGRMPRPEARGTERREAGREVFGETIACSKRQSDRPHPPGLATAPWA